MALRGERSQCEPSCMSTASPSWRLPMTITARRRTSGRASGRGRAYVSVGAVRCTKEVIEDPQLKANDVIGPLEGAGPALTSTISNPLQIHGVTKEPARRGPELGE